MEYKFGTWHVNEIGKITCQLCWFDTFAAYHYCWDQEKKTYTTRHAPELITTLATFNYEKTYYHEKK